MTDTAYQMAAEHEHQLARLRSVCGTEKEFEARKAAAQHLGHVTVQPVDYWIRQEIERAAMGDPPLITGDICGEMIAHPLYGQLICTNPLGRCLTPSGTVEHHAALGSHRAITWMQDPKVYRRHLKAQRKAVTR